MASKQPSITDVLRGLRQAALASLSEAGLSTHRVNLSVGLRLQVTRSGLRWLPCVDADTAQHRFEVEVDVDAEPHTPWPPLDSAPVALGEANDAEQLEHRLREEFEQLASQMPTSHRKLSNKKTLPKGKPKKKSPKQKTAKKTAQKMTKEATKKTRKKTTKASGKKADAKKKSPVKRKAKKK